MEKRSQADLDVIDPRDVLKAEEEQKKKEKMSKEEMEEKNTKDALELAKAIFNTVTDERFFKEYDEDMRHKVVIKKYPNFAQAYPVVLRLIARDLKYNENAFKKFLAKLKTDPGKGMEGFIERQADYAKLLYIEDCKTFGRHWNMKQANKIWNIEYSHMKKWYKKLQEDEKSAKNEFEEEQEKHLEVKRKELLDFINASDDTDFDMDPSVADDDLENYERAALGEHPKSLGDIDVTKLEKPQMLQFIRQLHDYKLSLHEEFGEKNKQMYELETKYADSLKIRPEDVKVEALDAPDIQPPNDLPVLETEEIIKYIDNLKKTIAEIEKCVAAKNKKLEDLGAKINKIEEQKIKDAQKVDLSEFTKDNPWFRNTKPLKNPRPMKKVIVKAKKDKTEKEKERKQKKDEIEKLARWISS